MNKEQTKRVSEALKNIEITLDGIKDLFPLISRKQIEIKLTNPKYTNPLKILKTIYGIIKKPNEDNAERKLNSLLGFLGITLQNKK